MEKVIQLPLAFILRNNPILRKHVENRTSRNKQKYQSMCIINIVVKLLTTEG